MSSVRDIVNLKSLSKLIKLDISKLNNAIGTYGIRAQGRFWEKRRMGDHHMGSRKLVQKTSSPKERARVRARARAAPRGVSVFKRWSDKEKPMRGVLSIRG